MSRDRRRLCRGIAHCRGRPSVHERLSVLVRSLDGMPLTVQEREQFLSEPHIAALFVASNANRGPLTVPIWYQYKSGGQLWVLTPAASRKAQLINRAGRFTLMVQRLHPTVRYVSVEGPVALPIPSTSFSTKPRHVTFLPRRFSRTWRWPRLSTASRSSSSWAPSAGCHPIWARPDVLASRRRGTEQAHPGGGASLRRLRGVVVTCPER
jgi:hypothetical protein